MRIYLEDDVRRMLPARELIASLADAFRRYDPQIVRMPTRLQLELSPGTVMLLMPCYDDSVPTAGFKLVTFSKEQGVQAAYWVLDPSSAAVIAKIDANYMTDL